MNYKILGTGSKGNALFVEEGSSHILIDCGVPYKKVSGLNIDVVLLTHIHGDHFNPATIKRLAAEHPMIYWMCGEYLVKPLASAGVRMDRIFPIKRSASFKGMQYKRFCLDHDVSNSGWVVWNDDVSFLYATDTSSLDNVTALGLDYYFVEANYGEDEIEDRIRQKKEAGEYVPEIRTRCTHMSKEQADAWLADNAGPDSIFIYMHEHTDAHKGDSDG